MAIMYKFGLHGRVAVITGAGKGIGAGIARAFAEAGASLVLAARTESDLTALAEELGALGSETLTVPTDVLDFEQLEALVEHTLASFGRIDILVNNAGVFPP